MNTHQAKFASTLHRFDPTSTSMDRHRLIAEAAFLLAEQRGFAPGREVADWLAGEQEVNSACGLIAPGPHWGAR